MSFIDHQMIALQKARRHRIAANPDHRSRSLAQAQPPGQAAIDSLDADHHLVIDRCARPGRGRDRQPGHQHRPYGGQSPQPRLGHAEKFGQLPPVGLGQDARRTALHELLKIGVVAPEHPRERRQTHPCLRGQPL